MATPVSTSDTSRSSSHTPPGKPKSPGEKRRASRALALLAWGTPGNLTPTQESCVSELRSYLSSHAHLRPTILNFDEAGEGEMDALCRWARARKFDVGDVKKMWEEAHECRAMPASHEYYPSPSAALGLPASAFTSLYPQGYFGHSLSGHPVFISKPSAMDARAVDACLSLEGVMRYHWYAMVHEFGVRLGDARRLDPSFKDYQCLCVVDVKGLSPSHLNKKTLAIIKSQAAVDSLCFPETMNRTLVLNAPVYFSAFWKIVRTFLDKRTAGKIEIFANKKKGHARLRELVAADQLPSDYGGTAAPTTEQRDSEEVGARTKVMHMRLGKASVEVEVAAGERMTATVYTKSASMAEFTVFNKVVEGSPWALVGPATSVTNDRSGAAAEDDLESKPTRKTIERVFDGPGEFRVTGRCDGWGTHDFVVVCEIHKTANADSDGREEDGGGGEIKVAEGQGRDEIVVVGGTQEVTWSGEDKKNTKKSKGRRWSLGVRKKTEGGKGGGK